MKKLFFLLIALLVFSIAPAQTNDTIHKTEDKTIKDKTIVNKDKKLQDTTTIRKSNTKIKTDTKQRPKKVRTSKTVGDSTLRNKPQ